MWSEYLQVFKNGVETFENYTEISKNIPETFKNYTRKFENFGRFRSIAAGALRAVKMGNIQHYRTLPVGGGEVY